MSDITLNLDFSSNDSVTIATIVNAKMLDATNVVSFGQMAIAHVQEQDCVNLLINFEHIQYMSSAGLTELLRINEVLKPHGQVVHLWGLNADIYNVFRITNLDKVFVIHQSESLDESVVEFNTSLASAAASGSETVQPGTSG